MNDGKIYDAAIIGGGLAGLSLSILLRKQGYVVILFEKEEYPFHKVCGEYISLESWQFLESLGLPLGRMDLPMITKLVVTSPDGNELKQSLPLGGFGISRYKIDKELRDIAVNNGVVVMELCKVDNISFGNEKFSITTSKGNYFSRVCCCSFGKRSNLDVKWNRLFTNAKGRLNNYIAIKYHVHTNFLKDTIALHNFNNGYCGISKIEDDKYCLCYLTTAANLKRSGNSISRLEEEILSENVHLKNIFKSSTQIFSHPLSISQISFEQKSLVKDHILMVGDAAGMIVPLCGNGMSMALHGAKITAGHISDFLQGNINRLAMEGNYKKEWNRTFAKRLKMGRIIQRFFGKPWLTNVFIRFMKKTPFLTHWLIKQTHGRPF